MQGCNFRLRNNTSSKFYSLLICGCVFLWILVAIFYKFFIPRPLSVYEPIETAPTDNRVCVEFNSKEGKICLIAWDAGQQNN